MSRYLITQSLLSSWGYLFSCYEGQEEKAQTDFMQTLTRVPSVPTEAMQNGIEFEREVYMQAANIPRTPHKDWEAGILAVAKEISGAQTQVRASREISVSGYTLLLYGVLDALKAGVIYDVKFTNKSIASSGSGYYTGKYLDSAQHPAYLRIVPEAYEFRYLISDGVDLCVETYRREETEPIEKRIADFLSYLDGVGLLPLYREKWLAK